jgi:nucleotide-binding universal stress UspA family protein
MKPMDTILEGIPKAMCYIDDILITGDNTAEHLEILAKVLRRLEEHGIREWVLHLVREECTVSQLYFAP